MTIILAERFELDDFVSSKLRVWKVWHIVLYILTAIFGIANAALLFQVEALVANRCIFYPKILAFHYVEVYNETREFELNEARHELEHMLLESRLQSLADEPPWKQLRKLVGDNDTIAQLPVHFLDEKNETNTSTSNDTIVVLVKNGQVTIEALMLHEHRSVFPPETDSGCQFAEYMPLLSATFAIIWTTLFIMCPSGGRATRLPQPWRILTPALVFAVVMAILTAFSFLSTNRGLLAFCASFKEHTNSTSCAPVNNFLERSWNLTITIGDRISAARAASAGVWACWTAICAILLARCLMGPDFQLKRTAVLIVKDPGQKVTPYLLKRKARNTSTPNTSPNKRNDNISVKSEPTTFTEIVTASVEHEDSEPTSLATTPLRERPGEGIEMTYSPYEYKETV